MGMASTVINFVHFVVLVQAMFCINEGEHII